MQAGEGEFAGGKGGVQGSGQSVAAGLVGNPLPGGKVALGSQHLVGGVHRVYRDRQFRRQPPLAGHPGAGGQGPGAHLSGQTAVQLFVQRHPGVRLQCGGQMDHDRVLLFLQNAKLAP